MFGLTIAPMNDKIHVCTGCIEYAKTHNVAITLPNCRSVTFQGEYENAVCELEIKSARRECLKETSDTHGWNQLQ